MKVMGCARFNQNLVELEKLIFLLVIRVYSVTNQNNY